MWRFLRGKRRDEPGEQTAETASPQAARGSETERPRPEELSTAPEPEALPDDAAASSGDAGEPEGSAPSAPAPEGGADAERSDAARSDAPHLAERARARHDAHSAERIDYTLDPRGEATASAVPEQDEDDLPVPPRELRPLSREDIVADALDRWTLRITGGEEPPSFLSQLRAGTVLDLSHSHPSGLAQLLAGRGPTRLSSLVREVGALADARAHARVIREVAESHAEEAGLTTCHLGIGEATWEPIDGSLPVHAPVLVRPCTLRLRGSAREDVDVDLDATADLNPVLLRALREAGVALDARALLATTDGPHGFDPTPVLEALRNLGQPLPGFRVNYALVVGNLMDAAGSVAADLAEEPTEWASHDLVAALAGDREARAVLAEQAAQDVDPESIPEGELVAAVDPDHRRVLARVLAGHHVAAATAPGTDGLGLAVDLAAELTGRGQRVLLVSQRRRSLAQLVRLAQERGLADLVFDLSPDPALQRNASAALLRSLRSAGSYANGAIPGEPDELVEARDILTGHVEAMHRIQQPWGVSAHEAISALAALTRRRPAPCTTVRLRADVAAAMIGPERERFADALREAAAIGVLSAGPEQSAWYGAPISTSTQAEQAARLIEELREDSLPRLRRAITATGEAIGLRSCTSLDEMIERLALLDRVRDVLAVFQPAVFRADLDELVRATGDKAWRAEHGVTLGWRLRRRLVKQASALQRPTAMVPDLHAALVDARAVRADWARRAADPDVAPSLPSDLPKAHRAAADTQAALDELAVLLHGTAAGEEILHVELDEVERRLHALDADRADLEELPRRTVLLRRLAFDGLGDLVEDLRSRRAGEEIVAAELELAWWQSVLELIAGAEPTISQYDGTSLSQVAERFRRLDRAQLAASADRIAAAADERRVTTMKAYPDTSRAAIAELARSSTVSVRDIAAKYEDILFRARPVWLASPHLVPQVIPRGFHFDTVIVADGGRLSTAAALPSLVRARTAVVVGDPLEYAGEDSPSVLDDMLRIAAHVEVLRADHPAGEGLRMFAQRRALSGEMRAMPGPTPLDPDRLVLVEGGRGPVVEGTSYVESTEAELRRVTELVIEHARTRPERSLAVLTVTEEHARRLMERIMQTVAVIPALRAYFDPSAPEFFTVVPASQASRIVRDDAIVSIGFGKTPHGRLLQDLGPLSGPDGRKALATIVTRARGRTTVVSSISIEDLDPARLRSEGSQDLRAMLWVLRGGADVPVTARVPALAAEGAEPGAEVAAQSAPTPEPETASSDEPGPENAGTGESGPEAASSDEPEPDLADLSDDDLDAAIEEALARRTGQESAPDPAPEPDPAVGVEADAASAEHRGDASPGHDDDESAARLDSEVAVAPLDSQGDASTPDPQGDASTPDPLAAAPSSDLQGTASIPRISDSVPDTATPVLETDALVRDLGDRLRRMDLIVEHDFGLGSERIELVVGHPEMPGRLLLAVDTDGERYRATTSQRERDRLRAERLEAVGWATERLWSWALFIDPDGEAERIRRSAERALMLALEDEADAVASGVGTIRHRLPRPQIPAGHPLSFYSSEDFDAVVEYICSDGRARLEDQLASEVRAFLGFESRSVLLDVSVSSAIRRYQERQ